MVGSRKDKIVELFSKFSGLRSIVDGSRANREVFSFLTNEDMLYVFDEYETHLNAPDKLERFFHDMRSVDFEHIRRHREAMEAGETKALTIAEVEPIQPDKNQNDSENESIGRQSLTEGAWAVCILAGGSGTRFFKQWPKLSQAISTPSEAVRERKPPADSPKGLFPITPVMGLNFLELILAQVLEQSVSAGKLAPVLLMTSGQTHKAIEAWLQAHPLWGFPKEEITLFRQAEIPRLDDWGLPIVLPDGSLMKTGNGHGGIYAALLGESPEGENLAETLAKRGVRYGVLGNVDNTHFRPLLENRLGYHIRKASDFTMSTVKRTDPTEKVGMVCRLKKEGKIKVIEYSVIDEALSATTNEAGELMFSQAHINTNLFSLAALKAELPGTLYTNKPVKSGEMDIASSTFEMLNQDLSPILPEDRVHVFEASREAIFTPTKAIVGNDSVETTLARLAEEGRARLEAACGERELTMGGDSEQEKPLVEFHPALGLDGDEEGLWYHLGGVKAWRLGARSRLYLCHRAKADEEENLIGENLTLEQGATLIIDVKKPYGDLRYDKATRAIEEDKATAGKITIGDNVTIKEGIQVKITIEDNGELHIANGYTFREDFEKTLHKGDVLVCS